MPLPKWTLGVVAFALLALLLWGAGPGQPVPGKAGAVARAAEAKPQPPGRQGKKVKGVTDKLILSDEEWRKRLTPEEYDVLRRHATERAGTGCFLGTKKPGTYVCAGCGNPLFESGRKFESGTGWPSFTQPVRDDALIEVEDRSYGMVRTEVRCMRCDGHLGHVFPDGPPPTGLRYCINSVAMKHVPAGQPIKLVEK